MNERIYKLADRAGEYADFESGICTDEFLEKFAELIVQKCAMVGNYAHDGGEYPGPMIKEYFGVK